MKEITVDAVVENIDTVTDFVNGILEENGAMPKAIIQMDVAIDEIFGNISHYSYSKKVGKATVKASVDNNVVSVIFIDNGVQYNPLEKKDPDITLAAEEREIGGLGIFMVKKIMDDIQYEYKDNSNVLTLKKIIK